MPRQNWIDINLYTGVICLEKDWKTQAHPLACCDLKSLQNLSFTIASNFIFWYQQVTVFDTHTYTQNFFKYCMQKHYSSNLRSWTKKTTKHFYRWKEMKKLKNSSYWKKKWTWGWVCSKATLHEGKQYMLLNKYICTFKTLHLGYFKRGFLFLP